MTQHEQGSQGMASDDVAQGGMGEGLQAGTSGQLVGDVDGVINALQGGLTAVPLEAAAGLVGRIQSALQGIGTPGVRDVAQSLGALQQALTTGQLDGAGPLLARLSAQVMDVAGEVPGVIGDRLRTLSGLLTNASEQLR
jgi:hypothetical protein